MKSKNSITIFDKIQKRDKIARRVIALMLVLVVVLTTCFASGFTKKEVKAETDVKAPDAYITYVINEMKADPNRKFVILEIVPDKSQGEFIYYCAQKEVSDRLAKLTKKELDIIYNYGMAQGSRIDNYFGNVEQVYAYDADEWAKAEDKRTTSTSNMAGGTSSNFAIKLRKNVFAGKYEIKVENVFLENVIPEYYLFLKDRLDVRCVEANDLTLEDVREADLIYINSKMHDSTQSLFELMNVIDANSDNRGTVSEIKNYDISGNAQSVVTYSGYENIADDPEGETIYTNNLKKYTEVQAGYGNGKYVYADGVVDRSKYNEEDKADYDFAVYEYKKVTNNGTEMTLKSRDISWDVAEEILELNMYGKEFPAEKDEKGNTIKAKVPILMDHTGIQNCKETNIYKLVNILFTVNNEAEIPAKLKGVENSDTIMLNGYDMVKKVMTTDIEAYTPGGLRTVLIDMSYYDATITSDTAVKHLGKTVTKTNDKYVVDSNDFESYFGYAMQRKQEDEHGFYFTIPEDKQYTINLADACTTDDDGNITQWKMFNIPAQTTATQEVYQVSMGDNYWRYKGTGALIPVNRFDAGSCTFADTRIKPNASGQYPTIDIIRYLLGAHGSEDSPFTPDPITGEVIVELNVLEIQPSNKFTFAPNGDPAFGDTSTDAIATWCGQMTEYEYTYQGDNTYKSTSAGAYTFKINVDAYTVNAVNGLNEDLIAKYDIIYIGVNNYNVTTKDSYNNDITVPVINNTYINNGCFVCPTLSNYQALYFHTLTLKEAGGAWPHAWNDNHPETTIVQSNDLTVAKAQEIKDFVSAGKILLLDKGINSTIVSTDTNIWKTIIELGLDDNVILHGAGRSGDYTDEDILTYLPLDQTPTLAIEDVKVDGVSAPINGDTMAYTGGLVSSVKGTSFTVKVNLEDLDPMKEYVTVFYIDENNDGIFGNSPSECREYHLQSKFEIEKDAEGKVTSIKDSFTRSLPENFNSALASWKVAVYEVATTGTTITTMANGTPVIVNAVNHDAEHGELAIIKEGGSIQEIRVLHIVDKDAGDDAKLDTIDAFETCLTNAATAIEYSASVTSVEMDDIDDTFVSGLEDNYDVIVVGLNTYADLSVNAKARDIIIDWVNSDKYIIFTNDLAGTMKTEANLTLDKFQQSDSIQSTGSLKTTYSASPYASNIVESLNDGSLMQYPYDITKTALDISATEPFYYQLLLDYIMEDSDADGIKDKYVLSDTDGDGDKENVRNNVVVWSTLTNGNTNSSNYFDAMHKDAMNNAYIYTNSNMTYMGLNSLATSAEQQLLVNAIIRAATKPQWDGGVSVYVNNGILVTGNYYKIYADLDYIIDAEGEEAEKLRAQEYVIEFNAVNADEKPMEGELRWKSATTNETYVLCEYGKNNVANTIDKGKLESREKYKEKIVDYKAVLESQTPAGATSLYEILISEIEAEKVKLEIYAKNDAGKDDSTSVTFRQRKMYNLK